MRIVFVSNYYNHHQSSLLDAFCRLSGGRFQFIATERMPEARRLLGYGQDNVPDYVLYSYLDENTRNYCVQLINDADVVICGSAPDALLEERIKAGKLIFRYAERPLKKGLELWKYPVRFIRWHRRNPMNKPIYMLCASAYTAGDYRKFGLFRNRCYKWGYFPEAKKYDEDELFLLKRNVAPLILWVGRYMPLKHADDAIRIAKRLQEDGYCFELNFIGTGELEHQLRQMISENDLGDCVHLLGSMKPEEVRGHMERANIYLFTSDRNEGWGAVLNESMNSGCAVVVGNAIGSVPFLLKDGENGLIYESGNVDMLYEKVKYLLDNPEEQERLGRAAYHTIVEEWNAEVAAVRFISLAEKILSGEKYPQLYETGPCSKAEIIK